MMSSPALFTLYVDRDLFSPYAMAAFVALHEKDLPFTLERIDLAGGQHHSAAYGALSLTRRVPTLVHGDFQLGESSAIIEYLEDLYPAPARQALYPADPRARAMARQIQAWLGSDLLPLREQRSTEVVFRAPSPLPLDAAGQAAADKLRAAATRLLADGQENLFGEWSIADAQLALMLHRLLNNDDPLPAALADYARRQWQRPSLQAWRALQD